MEQHGGGGNFFFIGPIVIRHLYHLDTFPRNTKSNPTKGNIIPYLLGNRFTLLFPMTYVCYELLSFIHKQYSLGGASINLSNWFLGFFSFTLAIE